MDQDTLRVAAYCRIPVKGEAMLQEDTAWGNGLEEDPGAGPQDDFAAQKKFYIQRITDHAGWTLAGIYADQPAPDAPGTDWAGFRQLMEDVQDKRIDYIVTKSIARFAGGFEETLDCIIRLRQMDPPVGIYFEEEDIDTLDAVGELTVNALSAVVQDRAKTASDRIRQSIQKKFQKGGDMVDLSRMLGYDRGPEGEWVINRLQAETVRYIFDRFLGGTSASRIAKELNEMGKKTARGSVWRADAVLFILRNEKYVGDCESQKTVTKDPRSRETAKNRGEAPSYYIRNHHEAIIDRQIWDQVQELLAEGGKHRKKNENRGEQR